MNIYDEIYHKAYNDELEKTAAIPLLAAKAIPAFKAGLKGFSAMGKRVLGRSGSARLSTIGQRFASSPTYGMQNIGMAAGGLGGAAHGAATAREGESRIGRAVVGAGVGGLMGGVGGRLLSRSPGMQTRYMGAVSKLRRTMPGVPAVQTPTFHSGSAARWKGTATDAVFN